MFEKTIALNEFITLQRGFDLPKDDRKNGNVPIIASTRVGGYHNEAKVDAPGVVIGRSGSIGGGQFITENFWPLNTTLWVKDFKGHSPRYVYYLLKSIDFKRFNVGSGVPTLNRNHLSSILVSDLGINTEKKIANILGTLDDKIALNNQINQTLESMAQAIFKSWFVDFDPVKAKIAALESGEDAEGVTRAAMRAISGKTDDELDKMEGGRAEDYAKLKATAGLFPAAMQDSELGEVPEGWEVKKVSHFVELAYGKALKKTVRVKGEIPVYGSGGVSGTHNMSLVEGPGVIVGRKGTVGSLYWEDMSFYPIDTVFYIKPIGEITLEFAYYLFQTLGLEYMNTDAAVPGLNRENVYRLEVPRFDEKLVSCFTDTVKSVRKIIAYSISEIYVLKNIRDTLLPKLLSGELSVDAVKFTEDEA